MKKYSVCGHLCAVLMVGCLAVFLGACNRGRSNVEVAQADSLAALKGLATDTMGLLVTQLRECSMLYTSECRLHKIIVDNDTRRISGKIAGKEYSLDVPFSERSVLIPVDVSVKAGIDLSQIGPDNVIKRGQHIEVILPTPHLTITGVKVDHDKVVEQVGLLRSHYTDRELTDVQHRLRPSIAADLTKLDIMEMARVEAARTLVPMIVALGYEERQISITFPKDNYTQGDVLRLLKSSSGK